MSIKNKQGQETAFSFKTSIIPKMKAYLYDHHLGVIEFASLIGLSRVSVYTLLKKDDMSISLLYRISKALNHDFFQYIKPLTATVSADSNTLELTNENESLKQRIASLELENSYLKEINKLLLAKEKGIS